MPFQADLEVSRLSTVIITTGGSSGLGQRTAAELAADPDRHVVITGRDAQRTHAAATAIGAEAQLLDLGGAATTSAASPRDSAPASVPRCAA